MLADPHEHEKARTRHKGELDACKLALLSPSLSPQEARIWSISAQRKLHVIQQMMSWFNEASRLSKLNGWTRIPAEWSLTQALEYKYAPTLLSLASILHSQQIPPKRWFAAQFATLERTVKVMTPFLCYGPKAFDRYRDWEAKQSRQFTLQADRESACVDLDSRVATSICESHAHALQWVKVLKDLKPPSVTAALLFLWPQSVSSWYVLAHDEFRQTLLDTDVLDDSHLLKCYRKWKRSPRLQKICRHSLDHAVASSGPLEF